MKFLMIVVVTSAILYGQTPVPPAAEAEYHILSDPTRDPWQQPDQVISALAFSPSETVAVVENGYPYFAPRIAPHVGKVYAINADPRAFQGPISLSPAISTLVSSWSDPHVSSLTVDTLIMVDLLRFIPQRAAYYLGIVAGLRTGGRLVIIDRPSLPSQVAPTVNITDLLLEAELPLAGFRFVQQFTLLMPYEYMLVFQR